MFCTAWEIYRTVAEALTPKTLMITNLMKLIGALVTEIMDGVMIGTSLRRWAIGMMVVHSCLM